MRAVGVAVGLLVLVMTMAFSTEADAVRERLTSGPKAEPETRMSGSLDGTWQSYRLLRKEVRGPIRGWVDMSDIFRAEWEDRLPMQEDAENVEGPPPNCTFYVGLVDIQQARAALAAKGPKGKEAENAEELRTGTVADLWENSATAVFAWDWIRAKGLQRTMKVGLIDCRRAGHGLNLAEDTALIPDVLDLPTPGKVWFQMDVLEAPSTMDISADANTPGRDEIAYQGRMRLRVYEDATHSEDALLVELEHPYGLRTWYDPQIGNPEPDSADALEPEGVADGEEYADYWDSSELVGGVGYGIIQYRPNAPLTETDVLEYEVDFTAVAEEDEGAGE
jgi:hypothetical protein